MAKPIPPVEAVTNARLSLNWMFIASPSHD
jgi:hypothetical protein